MKVSFCDTTLRDGEQAPGVSFRLHERMAIAHALDDLGLDVLEIGVPAMGPAEQADLRKILAVPQRAQVCTWNRARRKDIDASLHCGATSVHISIPVSKTLATLKFSGGLVMAQEQLIETVDYAHHLGLQVSIGFEDASRADPAFLATLCGELTTWPILRIRFADTVGILTPHTTAQQIAALRRSTFIPIEFHGHNDFGLAAANSLAALESGATWISTTVLGLGERAGNASMETVAVVAQQLLGMRVNLDFRQFPRVAKQIAAFANRAIPVDQPVIGDSVFTHESGIHVDGTLKDPGCYEPYDPATVGRQRSIVYGRHSGRHSIIDLLESAGALYDSAVVESLLSTVQEMAQAKKSFLLAEEVLRLYWNRLGGRDNEDRADGS